MNTPAHLIFGAALFARPDAWKINVAAIIGAFLPDFSLYFMVFWNRFINQIPFEIIFRDLYYSDFWQTIFAIDNSFFVWGLSTLRSIFLYIMMMAAPISGRSAIGYSKAPSAIGTHPHMAGLSQSLNWQPAQFCCLSCGAGFQACSPERWSCSRQQHRYCQH